MVSRATLTILFGYMAAFGCLQFLPAETGKKMHATPPQSAFARLAAGAVLPAAVATFGLTSMLLCAYVSALGRPDAAGARFVDRVASATMAAATVALLLLARLLADGLNAE